MEGGIGVQCVGCRPPSPAANSSVGGIASRGIRQMERRRRQSAPWVFSLLAGKFFVPCPYHEDAKKNEKNVFCVDCRAAICSHCSRRRHRAHRPLQVRRYVYQDVVRLEDLDKLYDCSSIQSYTTNNAKVVFLNQRPQSRPARCSGRSCNSCERTLQHPYRFCSLGCKVEYLVRHESGGGPATPAAASPPAPGTTEDAADSEDAHPSPSVACSTPAGARRDEERRAPAPEGQVATGKKRTTAVAAAAGAPGGAVLCGALNSPAHYPLVSFKRKGVPIRSPLY